MTDILSDLDFLWGDIVEAAKKPNTELDVKISIFDKGLKYASIKYKVQPDEIEGSAWNDYARKLQSDSGGRKDSKYPKKASTSSAALINGSRPSATA